MFSHMKKTALSLGAILSLAASVASAQSYTQNDARYVTTSNDPAVLDYVVCLERVVGSMPRNMAIPQALDLAQKACASAAGNLNLSGSGTSVAAIGAMVQACGFRPSEAQPGMACNTSFNGGGNNPVNPPVSTADTVTLSPRIIEVGEWAEGMANNGQWLWVAESGQRTVAKVDFDGGFVSERVRVGRLPVEMELFGGNNVYTMVRTDQQIKLVGKGRNAKTLTSVGECPEGMVSDARYLWALTLPDCSSGTSRVIRVDPNSGSKSQSPVLGEWSTSLASVGNEVWVGHARPPVLTIVDKFNLQPQSVNLNQLSIWAMDARDFNVYAAGRVDGTTEDGLILMIDRSTRQEIARASVSELVKEIITNDIYVVSLGDKGTIWVHSADDLSLLRTIRSSVAISQPRSLLFRRNDLLVTNGTYQGNNGAVFAFSNWQPGNVSVAPPPPPPPPPPVDPGTIGFPVSAGSWGGIVRGGPGTNFRRITSLNELEPVTLLRNTGVMMNGYPWFEIQYRGGSVGFKWGGILCWTGTSVNGVEGQCRRQQVNPPVRPPAGGKTADCFTTDYGHYQCRFKKTRGDGSFEITARGKDAFELSIIRRGVAEGFLQSPGDRPVHLPGEFIRQSDDRACWQNHQSNYRVCVW